MDSLANRSIAELLSLHAATMEELRTRNVLRSANQSHRRSCRIPVLRSVRLGPGEQLRKGLRCDRRRWDPVPDQGTPHSLGANGSRQLSAIRDPEGFDILAAVLFDDEFRILRAALIPAGVRARPLEVHRAHKQSQVPVARCNLGRNRRSRRDRSGCAPSRGSNPARTCSSTAASAAAAPSGNSGRAGGSPPAALFNTVSCRSKSCQRASDHRSAPAIQAAARA